MKTSIFIGTDTYAVIKTDSVDMRVLISAGCNTADSLRATVVELRAKSAQISARADLIESAIPSFSWSPKK